MTCVPQVRLHYDDAAAFANPFVWVWYAASAAGGQGVGAVGMDDWGPFFDLALARPVFSCKFKDGSGAGAGQSEGDCPVGDRGSRA